MPDCAEAPDAGSELDCRPVHIVVVLESVGYEVGLAAYACAVELDGSPGIDEPSVWLKRSTDRGDEGLIGGLVIGIARQRLENLLKNPRCSPSRRSADTRSLTAEARRQTALRNTGAQPVQDGFNK